MMQKEIKAGNKLIAEFIGLEKRGNCYREIEFYNGEKIVGNHLHPVNMKYHKSWDWLMPTINKICNTIISELDKACEEHDNEKESDLYQFYCYFSDVNFFDITIKSIYLQIICFITWYNENNSE